MRKALIFILTAIMLLMTACSSGGDKIKLTGGYVIWKTDSRTVICGRDNDGVVENVVGDYVTEYRWRPLYFREVRRYPGDGATTLRLIV